MPKQKTKSTAKKRFKLKKSGVIKRGQQNRRHNTGKKAQSQKMALRKGAYVSKADSKNIKQLINN